MIPKPRLDALTDGVFAVAMTLLVIDLRVPDSFAPKDAGELLHYLARIWNQVLVYVVSFYVLSLQWIGAVRIRPAGEEISEQYTRWTMTYLLLITFVPFSTMVVGRYISLPPAIWLYAGNIILLALVAIRMVALSKSDQASLALEDRLGLLVLIAASLLTVLLSLIIPRWAMLGYLLNLADKPLHWLLRRNRPSVPTT